MTARTTTVVLLPNGEGRNTPTIRWVPRERLAERLHRLYTARVGVDAWAGDDHTEQVGGVGYNADGVWTWWAA